MSDEARDQELRAFALQWLGKADEDMIMAEVLLSAPTAAKWGACFHAQQAAEKALKAVLVTQDRDVPYTHSLLLLRATLGMESEKLDEAALEQLSPWAVAGRYPEEIPEPSVAEAGRLVDAARSIVAFARGCIAATPSAEPPVAEGGGGEPPGP
jgi:HEPN domain-containing protein